MTTVAGTVHVTHDSTHVLIEIGSSGLVIISADQARALAHVLLDHATASEAI